MSDVAGLVADHLDIWTAATDRRGAARGGGKRIGFYGVERLRALILDLAVRGRLAPQDDNESHPPDLQKLRSKQVEPTCRIPANWLCLPLSALGKQLGGGTPAKSRADLWDGSIPWVSPKDMKQDRIGDAQMHVSEAALSTSPVKLVPAGSILFVVRGMILAHSFPVALTDVPVTINQDMKAIVLHDPEMGEYLLRTLKGLKQTVLAAIERSSHGTCRLDASVYGSLAIPIPPFAERRRIVAKIDELMALCDALERESAEVLTAHQTLVEALLATLVASPDAAALSAEWSRIENCFDVLFSTEASIDALKATVLELAVRGSLSPDSLSNGWTTSELRDLIGPMDSGWSPACHEFPARSEETWGVLKTTAVQYLSYEANQNKELPEKLSPRPEAECKAGDVLITRAGPTNRVGICCVVKATRPRLMISDKIIRFRPKSNVVDGAYLALSLSIGPAANQIEQAKSGMAASQVNISQTKLRAVKVAIPSLPEQRRIVARADELAALCDALKARIAEAGVTERHLADAVVERAAT